MESEKQFVSKKNFNRDGNHKKESKVNSGAKEHNDCTKTFVENFNSRLIKQGSVDSKTGHLSNLWIIGIPKRKM